MKKFKVLIGRNYELLSLTETDNSMPDDKDLYYDWGSDMKMPDFVLIRAADKEEAYNKGLAFIEEWKAKHQSERNAGAA
ncbi:hypothetical protein [Taibaiella chishuiensis]|uniref:Uncharacterized protein n=1 Tax=Taibaiella chishuiensis TaxID=1434707 RepID=A0A2P8D385_9BACT|nr:hypothetical protein [Taibaiella chishuiensis]PSK91682.1 hypothetical protein B0I18_105267 [Taibaiella chishuiensis]